MSIMDTFDIQFPLAPQPYHIKCGTVKYVDSHVYIDATGNKVMHNKTYNITLYDTGGTIIKYYNNHVGFHVDFIV